MNHIVDKIFGNLRRQKLCSCCYCEDNILSEDDLCLKCENKPSCSECGKIKLNVWTYSCGTFCKDCVKYVQNELLTLQKDV